MASRAVTAKKLAKFTLRNFSGYASDDLERFFARGLQATGTRVRGLVIRVTAAPQRSRGCADVAGRRLNIAIASPRHFSLRRFTRLLEHEFAHLRGLEHGAMNHRLLYSLGKACNWGKGLRLRYVGRSPPQLQLLRRERLTRSGD